MYGCITPQTVVCQLCWIISFGLPFLTSSSEICENTPNKRHNGVTKNMDFQYDQSTSKCLLPPLPSPYDNTKDGPSDDIPTEALNLSKEDLIRLLACFETELDGRDELIRTLKEEQARNMYFEAKYGRLSPGDPFLALRRDSETTEEILDKEAIGELYESQLIQLEKLIAVHKKSHNRAKMILSATERRHAKSLRELELEKERKSAYAAQGDDVVAFLEKEREKLQQQLDFQLNEVANAKKESEKLEKKLQQEQEKHKAMILYLVNERKQMVVKMHELRLKSESAPSSVPIDAGLVDELKKEVNFARHERDQLRTANKSLKAENLSLKEVVKGQEADLLNLRRNMISSTKLPMEPQVGTSDSSLVVTNRMATTSQPPRVIRLSSSSSFPAEKSRLPRAPSSPSRVPTTPTRTTASPRIPSSPTKKTPAMGIGVGTVRRQAHPTKFQAEPELQQLEEAIKGLEQNGGSSSSKRSNSLTRGRSSIDVKRTEPSSVPGGTVYRTEPGARPNTASAGLRIPSKVEKPVERKLSSTGKKSSLLKAFTAGK